MYNKEESLTENAIRGVDITEPEKVSKWSIAREFVNSATMIVVDDDNNDTEEEVMDNMDFWNDYYMVFKRDDDDLPMWDTMVDFRTFEEAKKYCEEKRKEEK